MQINEFKIINKIIELNCGLSSDKIKKILSLSDIKVKHSIKELTNKGLISEDEKGMYIVTLAGMKAMDKYKVKNAVIMAAGMSSRFAPLSYEKPKGLLNVKGEILIEREIRQLNEIGIKDIIIVVGYMKEKFFYLEEKFGVKIVVNSDYYRYNNTSSLIRVVDKLSNTYICSSDNYFVENVFEKYVYKAYYSAVYASGKTDEYCLKCNKDDIIKNVTIGGYDSWFMLGHVYFDNDFSRLFCNILKKEYEDNITKTGLWEDLYIRYIDKLPLSIKRYDCNKVLEFDSIDDLRKFDNEYINNIDSQIMRNICTVLNCKIKDIVNIIAIKAGLTNTSFRFTVNDTDYVYRHPGKGTDQYINRRSEAFSMKVASKLKLDDTFIYMDEKEGWKISYFIKDARELDYHNKSDVTKALKVIKKLHDYPYKSDFDFDIWNRAMKFVESLKDTPKSDFDDFQNLKKIIEDVHDRISGESSKKCLCHCDCYSPNFLFDKNDNIYLIDWEYSGNEDEASDLGTFICCSDYTYEQALDVIKEYLGHTPDNKELAHYLGYISVTSYFWYLWALHQESIGKNVGEFLLIWYNYSKLYASKAKEYLE